MTVTIPGKPMTWARAQVGVNSKTGQRFFHTDPLREARAREISLFWKTAGHDRIAKPAGIAMRCEFVFDRPDGHFGTGRNRGILKERFRHARPGLGKNGGDLDNLVKLVKDALNHVGYEDDSQVAELEASKRYIDAERGEQAHTVVTLLPLDTGLELPEPEAPHAQLDLASAAAA
jgi:Holliday junction resolvase RusA-like endonuclease